MTEAGYPKGFKAEMVIRSSADMVDMASMLIDYWKKHLGVEVELKPYEYAAYTGILNGKKYKQMIMSSGTPYAIREGVRIYGLTGEMYNTAMFSDPYFDETFYKAEKTPNPAEAKKIFKELNVYLIDKALYVILPTAYSYSYAWPWVKNWYGERNVSAGSAGPVHARIWLDLDLREKMIGKR